MAPAVELLPAELPSPDPIAAAARSGALRAPGFVLARATEDVAAPAERFEEGQRAQLARALEARLAPHAPHVRVLEALRSLARPGASLVLAGQQPGLLAAPLLTLHKALHVLRLARSLEQAWERPVVAAFWNHADDHDVAEVHHAWLVNEHLDLQRVALAGVPSTRQPIGRLRLDDARHGLPALRALLLQMHAREPHAEAAVELLAPRHGETLATALTRSLTGLLGHLGLVVIEPDWIREELSRALARVVQVDPRAALQAGAEGLRARGHEPAIEPATAALLFRVDEAGRSALRAGGEGFRYDGEPGSRTPAELVAQIVEQPEGWSPGALLRPLAQDLCLPVAAYVGGPAELAYHAQLGPLREAAGVPATPFVARWSCTLLEPEVQASLERAGLGLADVLAARAVPSGALGAPATPAVVAELRELAQRAERDLLALRSALAQIDRGLAQNLGRSAAQARGLVEKLCEKAERAHRNRLGLGLRHLRRVESALVPRGELQERVLGPLPFLARHGRGWVDALFEALGPFEGRHAVLRLDPSPARAPAAGAEEDPSP